MAEGKSLPEYKGDREPRKGKGKGKKVTKTAQKADQADQAEETGDELDRMNVDEPEQAAPPRAARRPTQSCWPGGRGRQSYRCGAAAAGGRDEGERGCSGQGEGQGACAA